MCQLPLGNDSQELHFARSIVATATFFATGVLTTHIFHDNFGPIAPLDWSFGVTARYLLSVQMVPLAASTLLYLVVSDESAHIDRIHTHLLRNHFDQSLRSVKLEQYQTPKHR
jgi:hypothetical protein